MKKIIVSMLTAIILFLLAPATAFSASTELDYQGVSYKLLYNGTYSVSGCDENITHLKIADQINGIPVTEISNQACTKKNNLKTVEIPNSITYIGSNPFSNCQSLKSITVSSSNPNYHSKNDCLIETETNKLISGCQNSKVPEYVTIISHDAFYGCTELKSIKIPASVTHIYAGAFYNCTNLKNVEFADSGLVWIGGSAFEKCDSLKKVYIPSSVRTIEEEAFQYCKSLTKVEIPASVRDIGKYAFDSCNNLTDVYCEQEETRDNYWHKYWLGRNDATVHWNSKMSSRFSFNIIYIVVAGLVILAITIITVVSKNKSKKIHVN